LTGAEKLRPSLHNWNQKTNGTFDVTDFRKLRERREGREKGKEMSQKSVDFHARRFFRIISLLSNHSCKERKRREGGKKKKGRRKD